MKHWLIVNKRELSKKGERVSVTITKVGTLNMPQSCRQHSHSPTTCPNQSSVNNAPYTATWSNPPAGPMMCALRDFDRNMFKTILYCGNAPQHSLDGPAGTHNPTLALPSQSAATRATTTATRTYLARTAAPMYGSVTREPPGQRPPQAQRLPQAQRPRPRRVQLQEPWCRLRSTWRRSLCWASLWTHMCTSWSAQGRDQRRLEPTSWCCLGE